MVNWLATWGEKYIYMLIHISTYICSFKSQHESIFKKLPMDQDLKGKIKTIKVLEEIQEGMFMA